MGSSGRGRAGAIAVLGLAAACGGALGGTDGQGGGATDGDELTADFGVENALGDAPLQVAFHDLSTGSRTGWEWEFGDGASSSEAAPVHTYATPGGYSVALTVRGPAGSDRRLRPDVVRVLDPDAVGLWTSARELAVLPLSGPAWSRLRTVAEQAPGLPNVADQEDDTDVRVVAKALVYARTGVPALRDEVVAACLAAIDSELGGRTLALGRNLLGYVVAADLVVLPPAEDALFRAWLRRCLDERLDGLTLVETHELRPNNWGTHAGASRIAVALYLGDQAELARAAQVFRGWLGERSAYAGFAYGELDWQADPAHPVGINARGALRDGHSIDGVLADDQRRSGPFLWPPPRENYVWEALQGALAQAVLLYRAGYDVWSWSDQALLRALEWLHGPCAFPAEGDDTWLPHLVNYYYGADFPAPVPSSPGKNMGWSDWTHP